MVVVVVVLRQWQLSLHPTQISAVCLQADVTRLLVRTKDFRNYYFRSPRTSHITILAVPLKTHQSRPPSSLPLT